MKTAIGEEIASDGSKVWNLILTDDERMNGERPILFYCVDEGFATYLQKSLDIGIVGYSVLP